MITRRDFVQGGIGATAALAILRATSGTSKARELSPRATPIHGRTVALDLVAAERATALPAFGGRLLPMWTFTDGTWPPVVRLNLGDALEASLTNHLPRPDEHTSIHWHGIRLPNAEDGVPYLVQDPVRPGDSFRYAFVPPDTGTFFFHTHCNTAEQLGRGLVGVLIVEGDTTEPYDADEVLLLHDWQVDPGATGFNPFFTLRGAGRAGTYGSLRSVNGITDPLINLPAGGDCRLRIINADPTRVVTIGIEGTEAAIVAIDGAGVPPFPLTAWPIGTGMRIDLVVRAPAPGRVARLYDSSQPDRVALARLVGVGPDLRRGEFDPLPLRADAIPQPDLGAAERIRFNLAATNGAGFTGADGSGFLLGPLCLSSSTFWSINDRSWPDRDHAQMPPPLAVLERGRSYVFEITNGTSFTHPIHLHGHSFKVLSTNKVPRPLHFADTLLIYPDEKAEIAFVADNPGDWMFHCHIIEHQETGMMGYVRVL